MSSIKRKALESQIQRRVRARRDPSEEPLDSSELEQSDGAHDREDSEIYNAPDTNESGDSVGELS